MERGKKGGGTVSTPQPQVKYFTMQKITCYDCKAEINAPKPRALYGIRIGDLCLLSIEGMRHSISFRTEISAGLYETGNQPCPIIQSN